MDAKQLLDEIRGSGLTQVEVALAIGVSQGTISKIERGQTKNLWASTYTALQKLHSQRVAGTGVKTSIVAKATDSTALASATQGATYG
jgi:transcriptional regulator with XRE-family HTH domain